MFQPRHYRRWQGCVDLVSFQVAVAETDLYLAGQSLLIEQTQKAILKYRLPLEEYIQEHSEFLHSLKPLPVDESMPEAARMMAQAAARVGVGPMAAVAGVLAELVGRELLHYSPEIIVENGGDIFIVSKKTRMIGIYAGEDSLFSGRLAIKIKPKMTPLGICTSSGMVGHSFSLGKSDSVTVLAQSTALADAAATAIGNLIQTKADLAKGIEFAREMPELSGAVLIKEDKLAVYGEIELAKKDIVI